MRTTEGVARGGLEMLRYKSLIVIYGVLCYQFLKKAAASVIPLQLIPMKDYLRI
jgi:hypothetical protein